MICSRYEPEADFSEVIGERLATEQQIDVELFPEEDDHGEIGPEVPDSLTAILLTPESQAHRVAHNRTAVLHRYSLQALCESIEDVVARLDRQVVSA